MSTERVNFTDLLQEVIEQAVEVALRKALEGNAAGNRRLLSPEETATYLSLSKREIYNMIANDQIAVVTHGRRKMLDIRDVDEVDRPQQEVNFSSAQENSNWSRLPQSLHRSEGESLPYACLVCEVLRPQQADCVVG